MSHKWNAIMTERLHRALLLLWVLFFSPYPPDFINHV
jgi:hypothetical protein